MNPASKQKWKQTARDLLPMACTFATLYLLRACLHIHSLPLVPGDGWLPWLAWIFIFHVVWRFYERKFFRVARPQPPPTDGMSRPAPLRPITPLVQSAAADLPRSTA